MREFKSYEQWKAQAEKEKGLTEDEAKVETLIESVLVGRMGRGPRSIGGMGMGPRSGKTTNLGVPDGTGPRKCGEDPRPEAQVVVRDYGVDDSMMAAKRVFEFGDLLTKMEGILRLYRQAADENDEVTVAKSREILDILFDLAHKKVDDIKSAFLKSVGESEGQGVEAPAEEIPWEDREMGAAPEINSEDDSVVDL